MKKLFSERKQKDAHKRHKADNDQAAKSVKNNFFGHGFRNGLSVYIHFYFKTQLKRDKTIKKFINKSEFLTQNNNIKVILLWLTQNN